MFSVVAESISAFAWEPIGHRFACIHGDAPRIAVSFYNVRKGGSVELISKYAAFLLRFLVLCKCIACIDFYCDTRRQQMSRYNE